MKNDKIMHLVAGAAIAFWCGGVPYLDNKVLFDGLWAALFSGLIAGLVKEYTDYRHTKVWGWLDFAYTAIGALCIVVFIICLHFAKG